MKVPGSPNVVDIDPPSKQFMAMAAFTMHDMGRLFEKEPNASDSKAAQTVPVTPEEVDSAKVEKSFEDEA